MNDTEGQRLETMLTPLVRELGIVQVEKDLWALFGCCDWSGFQRALNIAGNISRRINRKGTNQHERTNTRTNHPLRCPTFAGVDQ